MFLALDNKPGKMDRMILDGRQVDGAPEEIQILPYGHVKSKKGKFFADEQAFQQIIANFDSEKNDIVIDYEHQTLKDVQAPAAGWIKSLMNKGREGLWAQVEWTKRAGEYLANKEYRYLSPVIWVKNSDKRPAIFHSAALTNVPAVDGMVPLVNKHNPDEGDEDMEFREMILKALGLPEDATDDQVNHALEQLKKKDGQPEELDKLQSFKDEVMGVLEMDKKSTADQVKGKIISLKNPAGYVPVEQFDQLKKRLDEKDRDDLVQNAMKNGKIAPAQKEWAEEYALKDPSGFKAFLDQAPVVVPVGTDISGGNPSPEYKGGEIDEMQLQVNKMLGIDDKEFKEQYGEGEK
ncbi:MAG: hypothetical protein FH756_02310 [Firmicutes bacterium]|nr:hypothetical protein [Bacillota bacterium]